MPSLMLRHLPVELLADLRAFARSQNVSVPIAAEVLLRLGLATMADATPAAEGRAREILKRVRQSPES